jgi:YD repeat-containing protein
VTERVQRKSSHSPTLPPLSSATMGRCRESSDPIQPKTWPASPRRINFYDGDGRRVKKDEADGTTVFVYDAQGQLASRVHEQASDGQRDDLFDKRSSGEHPGGHRSPMAMSIHVMTICHLARDLSGLISTTGIGSPSLATRHRFWMDRTRSSPRKNRDSNPA